MNMPLPESLADKLEQTRAIREEIRGLYERLSKTLRPNPELHAHLSQLWSRQDKAATELGYALMEWTEAGGKLERRTAEVSPAAPPKVSPAVIRLPEPSKPAPSVEPAKRTRSRAELERDLFGRVEQAKPTPSMSFAQFTRGLDAPKAIENEVGFLMELDQLQRAVDRLSQVTDWQRSTQRTLLACLVARARHLAEGKDPFSPSPRQAIMVEDLFPVMTRFSAIERPGFVVGLSRSHRPPEGETWLSLATGFWSDLTRLHANADELGEAVEISEVNAENILNDLQEALEQGIDPTVALEAALEEGIRVTDPRLIAIASQFGDVLRSRSRFKALRRAVRDAAETAEQEEQKLEAFPDWEHLGLTRGKNMVIVGGAPRTDAVQRLKTAFEFADVSWPADVMGRRLDTIVERIAGGKVDVVMFLARLSSHRAQDALRAACKRHNVPFIRMESSYGVSALRHEIEQGAWVTEELKTAK